MLIIWRTLIMSQCLTADNYTEPNHKRLLPPPWAFAAQVPTETRVSLRVLPCAQLLSLLQLPSAIIGEQLCNYRLRSQFPLPGGAIYIYSDPYLSPYPSVRSPELSAKVRSNRIFYFRRVGRIGI